MSTDVDSSSKKKSSSRGGGSRNKTGFRGRLAAIDGSYYVYDMIAGRADQYITTTHELTIYWGAEYGPHVLKTLHNEELETYDLPTMPQIKEVADSKWRDKDKSEMTFMEEKWMMANINQCVIKQEKLLNDMGKIYADIEGQCSPSMMNVVKAHKKYKMARANCDALIMLSILKEICNKVGVEVFPLMAILLSLTRVLSIKQASSESIVHYEQRFTNAYNVFTASGGHFLFPGLLNFICQQAHQKDYANCSTKEQKAANKNGEEYFLATLLLMNSGPQFAELRKDVNNDHVRGQTDSYPSTIVAVMNLLLHFKCEETPAAVEIDANLMFVQGGNTAADKQQSRSGGSGGSSNGRNDDGNDSSDDKSTTKDLSLIRCHDCHEMGHYKNSEECTVKQQRDADIAELAEMKEEKEKTKKNEKTEKSGGKTNSSDGKGGGRVITGQQFFQVGTGGFLDDIDEIPNDEPATLTGTMFCQVGTAVDGMEVQSENHRSAFTQNGSDAAQLANARNLASDATTVSAPKNQHLHYTYCDAITSRAKSGINRDWSLLDSQSTCNLFTNGKYLVNI